MAISMTNTRTPDKAYIGFGWQASKGTAVTPSHYIERSNLTIMKGQVNLPAAGGTGNKFFNKTGIKEIYEKPTAKLSTKLNRAVTAFLIESFMHGSPTLTTYTESGDTNNQLASLVLTGVRMGINTSASGVLYASITASATSYTVTLYKDSARSNSVCAGTRVGNGSITLSATNSSGLSGTIAITYHSASTSISFQVDKITYPYVVNPARYFSLYYEDGESQFYLTDCVVKMLTVNKTDGDAVDIEADIVAHDYTATSNALTIGTLDTTYFTSDGITVRRDPDSSPTDLAVEKLTLTMDKPNLRQYPTNAAKPAFTLNEGYPSFKIDLDGVLCDETQQLIDDAHAITFKDISNIFTYGDNILTIKYSDVLWIGEPAGVNQQTGEYNKISASGEAFGSTSSDEAVAITLEI